MLLCFQENDDCRVGPDLNEIYGKDIENEYLTWLETLRVKVNFIDGIAKAFV